ncbi:DNA/RNA non-specific endonuclease [Cryobacterium sp. Y62]|uniref:DNA/RNA non-specific endonuclease n=1 Tax=Cryobacterium sp. Y62 TaxID=2048284 RepID=UPI001E594427|nr:DNA/RNA non-specific endonuclease [Cryobacterium sp. Y62]
MHSGDRDNITAKLGWVGLGHDDILPAKTNLHRSGVNQTRGSPNGNRLSVFTAPVLSAEDPIYRGVKIPQAFWKIAAWTTTTKGPTILHAAGFVLDQSPQLEDIDLDTVRTPALMYGKPPPLGPYRT